MGRGRKADMWGSKVEEKIRALYGIERVDGEKDIGGDGRQGQLKISA